MNDFYNSLVRQQWDWEVKVILTKLQNIKHLIKYHWNYIYYHENASKVNIS